MIELRLHEFEEKDKQMRMREHINRIVREISGQFDRNGLRPGSPPRAAAGWLTRIRQHCACTRYIRKLGSTVNKPSPESRVNSLYFILPPA